MTGTLINAGAIIAGGLIGLLIHARLPRRLTDIAFQGVGLVTMAIGISMAVRSERLIVVVVSVVLGSLCGQWIDIEGWLEKASQRLHNRVRIGTERFSEGLVTATMLFCVGSLSILGPIEEGTGESPDLLMTKSVIDLISAAVLAVSFGISILFSAVPVLLYQGAVTLFASGMSKWMTAAVIADMTATGGVLLIGLGIGILGIKKIPVTNMLPSLVFAVALSYFLA